MQPFYTTSIKILPFSNEVLYNGTVFKSPQELWDALHRAALSFSPSKTGPQIGDMVIKEQVFHQDPEVAEFLRTRGVTKLPSNRVVEAQRAAAKKAVVPKPTIQVNLSLEDLDL